MTTEEPVRTQQPAEGGRDDAAAFWAGLDIEAAPSELVALGGRLDPGFVYAAYRHGCFPWPAPDSPVLPWCSPDPRAVLRPADLRLPRSLRSRLRGAGWTTSVDLAFTEVLARCADRPATWITPAMQAAYRKLHGQGLARSVEVWADDETLVGGLYGVLVGGVFSGESMFSARSDASKVAVADLVARLRDGGGTLVDCQQETPHLVRMGMRSMPRHDFLAVLAAVRDDRVQLTPGRLLAARLVPAAR